MSESNKVCLKYFVGGIPSDVQHKDLYEFFSTYGAVKKITVFNSNKGRKLFGFCFIKFKNIHTNDLNDKRHVFCFKGRQLEVDPIVRRSSLKQSVQEKHAKRVFLQNVPREFTQEDLFRVFSMYGPILNCFVIDRNLSKTDDKPETNPVKRTNNYGYVIFHRKEDAESLVERRFVQLRDQTRIYIKKYCSTINRNCEVEEGCPKQLSSASTGRKSTSSPGCSSEGEETIAEGHCHRPTVKAYFGVSRSPCYPANQNLRFNCLAGVARP